ncbi:hypothetical protein ACN28S_50100 [Cystobacter fuscus]
MLIVERSKAVGINPLYMLARIQTESSLITSGTSTNLAKATGCGCPDSAGCDTSYAGFGNRWTARPGSCAATSRTWTPGAPPCRVGSRT